MEMQSSRGALTARATRTIRPIVIGAFGVWTLAILLLAIAAVAHHVTGRPFDDFATEAASSTESPFYLGFVSTAGGLAWWTAAVVAVVSAVTVRHLGDRALGNRLLGIGLFTAYMGVDDLFMLHDAALPQIGIGEKASYVAQALIVLTYIAVDRRFILTTPLPLLLIAGALFATSIIEDQVPRETLPLPYALEDSSKTVGIFTYALWVAVVAFRSVRDTLPRPASAAPDSTA